jgi:ParB-like chromosome segregation protein Spo0J
MVEQVEISGLSFGYSPRSTPIDQAHVRALAEVIDQLPPIVVERDSLKLVDGAHRVAAFELVGRSHIPAVFFAGETTEALALAVQANIKHGKPLTRAERQAAAAKLLRLCPERSDRWLGDVCGLSHSTVAKIRRDTDRNKVAVRTGRDGRRRPVDAAVGRARAEQAIADMPGASIRTVAAAAGVAAATAKRAATARATAGRATSSQSSESDTLTAGGISEADDADLPSRPDLEDYLDWLSRTDVASQDLDPIWSEYLLAASTNSLTSFGSGHGLGTRCPDLWNSKPGVAIDALSDPLMPPRCAPSHDDIERRDALTAISIFVIDSHYAWV